MFEKHPFQPVGSPTSPDGHDVQTSPTFTPDALRGSGKALATAIEQIIKSQLNNDSGAPVDLHDQ